MFEFQSGFRKAHSTETSLVFLTDMIRQEIDNGKFCGLVMLDLQKAFDTVDHGILIRKLEAMGFNEGSLKWMTSYLESRIQMVDVDGTLSSKRSMGWGVPQGSILGPSLFLLYINDLSAAVSCNLFLYADDSVLMVSHKDKPVVEDTLSAELDRVCEWLANNKLSLHTGKSEAILFGSKIRLSRSPGFSVRVGECIIKGVEKVKYLGCILDNCLTGEEMTLRNLTKIHQKIKFISRKASFLDSRTLHLLAGALVQCHFDYAAISWYTGLTQRLKGRLQTAQNKLIRVILRLHPRTHLEPEHLHKLNWLKVEKCIIYIKLMLTFKIILNLAPKYLLNYFLPVRETHQHSTRGRTTDFVPCRFKTMIGKNSFRYNAAVLWNKLWK